MNHIQPFVPVRQNSNGSMKILDIFLGFVLGIIGGGYLYLKQHLVVTTPWGGMFYAFILGMLGILGQKFGAWMYKLLSKQSKKWLAKLKERLF